MAEINSSFDFVCLMIGVVVIFCCIQFLFKQVDDTLGDEHQWKENKLSKTKH